MSQECAVDLAPCWCLIVGQSEANLPLPDGGRATQVEEKRAGQDAFAFLFYLLCVDTSCRDI